MPDDLRYSSDHEWVRVEGATLRVGITDYAQDALGDVVYVEVPEVGATVTAGDKVSEVESTKSVSDIYAPLSGTVVEVNDELSAAPERLNEDPVRRGLDLRDPVRRRQPGRRPARRRGLPRPGRRLGARLVADVYCNSCGHRNALGANFCSSCGAVLETASADNTTITFHPTVSTDPVDAGADEVDVHGADLPADIAVLVVTRGPYAGSRFPLASTVTTAGRHPESSIFLDDVTVSRRHAEIEAGPDGFTVRDVGSLNGTYLNRERIEEAPLVNGDELQIGKFKLVFVLGSGSEAGD